MRAGSNYVLQDEEESSSSSPRRPLAAVFEVERNASGTVKLSQWSKVEYADVFIGQDKVSGSQMVHMSAHDLLAHVRPMLLRIEC